MNIRVSQAFLFQLKTSGWSKQVMEMKNSTHKELTTKQKGKTARDSKARTASAAVFFNENKSIAGFGNSMRAVFTSVRELVENSLDASEKRSITPKISISLRRLEKKELIELMGTKVIKTKDKRVEFIELYCKDNGVGVPRDLIPQLFGTVLAGTKYGAQQTRGRFGLGSKMVLLYAMSTLDLPIEITTRPEGEDTTYRVRLFINLEENKPIIASDEEFKEGDEDYFDDYGTQIKVSFTGSWKLAKLYVREYFRQLAIITPYMDMHISLPPEEGEEKDIIIKRVVDEIPKPPEVVKIHPWGTDISTFRREMNNATESNLIQFLVNNFMGVTKSAAEAFYKEVEVDPNQAPHELTSQEIRRIVHDGFNRALKESKTVKRRRDRIFKFEDPKGDALSPLGADRLRKGLEKELNPEFVESLTRPPRAYEGHPFIIEAAIGYGGGVNAAAQSKGGTVVENRIIYRFANRIPLVFGAGSDLITNITNSINWSEYGLTRGSEPLAIAVSLVSTKIPFPETSKEYIDKVEEIGAEVRLTLLQLGRKLKTFLGRRRRRQREHRRKSRFERFAPNTVINLLEILKKEQKWDPTTGVSSERIIAALASGKPRISSSVMPLGDRIYQTPIWSRTKTHISFQNNGIYEIATFFRTPNYELSQISGLTERKIDQIKRRTIDELDKANQIPELKIETILSSEDEVRFHRRDIKEKLIELPRLGKACYRRWIRNAYDYMVSTPEQLDKILGLSIKLIEAERVMVIRKLADPNLESDDLDSLSSYFDGDPKTLDAYATQSETAIVIDELKEDQKNLSEITSITKDQKLKINLGKLIPPIDELYKLEVLKKRKVNSILEFLLETTHPSSPIDQRALAPLMIPVFKNNLKKLVQTNPRIGNIKVDVSSQVWIDGYLRNAFKRRKISSINDVISTSDEVLIEISELQRILFNKLLETIIPKNGKIRPEEYKGPHPQVKVTLLEFAGINSLEEFAVTSSLEIANSPKLKGFLELIIEESKDKIMEFLTLSNQLGTLNLLKEIPRDLELELDRLYISDSMKFLSTPVSKFNKKYHERVTHSKKQIGTNFNNFFDKHATIFKNSGVVVLEELVFNSNHYLKFKLNKEDKDVLIEAVEYLMMPVVMISPNLIPSLNLLLDAGVNTIGKFLVWPLKYLSKIIDMTEEWINLIRESFHIRDVQDTIDEYLPKLEVASNILDHEEIKLINSLQITTIPEAVQLKWGDYYPNQLTKWRKIHQINSVLTGPIEGIFEDVKVKKEKQIVEQALNDLKTQNIESLLQFIRLPTSSIVQQIKTKAKRNAIAQLSIDLSSSQPKSIDVTSNYYQAARIHLAIEKLKSPIVFLSEFTTRDISILNDNGISSVHQLFTESIDEISKYLDKSEKNTGDKIKKSVYIQQGTSLSTSDNKGHLTSIISFEREGNRYFEREEINSLSASGYDTIESLFYSSDHRTFDVRGISWDVIRHFKKLMISPPVLITWKKIVREEVMKPVDTEADISLFEETRKKDEKGIEIHQEKEYQDIEYYKTFTSSELERLTSANINRVIDFVTVNSTKLQDLLGWDRGLTKERQTTIILQEAGIELSDLNIFRADHVDHLKELGLVTIEDLYFTAKEEGWESSIIPWESIKTLKNILHLPLKHVVEEIGRDILELLNLNEISTILEFILTGDPILEQNTGLPAERFENLKYALDFGTLLDSFDKTVLFTPGLTYSQTKTLHDKGYKTILQLVISDVKQVSKDLSMPVSDIRMLFDQIHRAEILQTEDERGISIRQLRAFSRSDSRSIAKSGIFEMNEMDTLQEVLYQISPDIFQGENYLLEQVINLQKVSTIELNNIGDLNENDVKLLNKYNIQTIADALLVEFDGEVDQKLNNSLSVVSRSLLDLLPFMAMGNIKSQAAMVEGRDDSPLLETWMTDNDHLHERTMRNIRSLLSLPVKLTSYSRFFEGEIEELGDKTVADVYTEYVTGEDHPLYILQNKLNETGSLISLLREGSTPLTLLDLEPQQFRALINDGINTVERVMMNDAKHLSNLSGNTQKYWREIKSSFDSESFKSKLSEFGIPVSVLSLSKNDLIYLDRFGISYLDEITVYDQPKGPIKQIKDFLYSPTLFLVGSPGERELAENRGAQSIIEAVLALRPKSGFADYIHDMFILAWNSFLRNLILLPKKFQDAKHKTIQDLSSSFRFNRKSLTQNQKTFISPFFKSPLLLALGLDDLERTVFEYRCSNIIDALTSPLLIGKIDEFRESLKNSIPLDYYQKIEISNELIKKISKSVYNRVSASKMSLQDLLSSPRSLNEYNSISKRYLNEARLALRIPLSRIHLYGNQTLLNFNKNKKYLRLEDVLLDLSNLYTEDPKGFEFIKTVLSSKDLKILNEIALPDSIKKAADTAFGFGVDGFHDLWVTTWKGVKIITKIETKPSILLASFIRNASSDLSQVKEIKPIEIWHLWVLGKYTISDLLLTPSDSLGSKNGFTKKRIIELQNYTTKQLLEGTFSLDNSILDFANKLGIETNVAKLSLAQLMHPDLHPLIQNEFDEINKVKKILSMPFMPTDLGNQMKAKEIQRLHKIGIYTLGDLLAYPHELMNIPKSMRTLSSRYKIILEKHNEITQDISIGDLKLPNVISSKFDSSTKLSEVLFETEYNNLVSIKKALVLPLKYSDLSPDIIVKLNKLGMTTIYDFLHMSSRNLSQCLGIGLEEANNYKKKLDLEDIFNQVKDSPLQVNEINALSKGAIAKLQENDVHTLLDLKMPLPAGLNRIDTNYLNNFHNILESDPSYLLALNSNSINLYNNSIKFNHSSVRSVISNRSQYEKSITDALVKITADELYSLQEKHRSFHELESIVIRDEQKFLAGGLYTLISIAKSNVEDLMKLSLTKAKIEELLGYLNSHWRNIIEMPRRAEEIAIKLKLYTVAEVLSYPQIFVINFDKPIKIKMELKLNRLLDHVPRHLIDSDINTVSELIQSKKMIKLFKSNDQEIVTLISIFNSEIGNISDLNKKWIGKLNGNDINRVWQYIVEDTNALASFCGTSVKAQEDFKNKLRLDSFTKNRKFEIPIASKEDKDLFSKYGLFSLNDILLNGMLKNFIDSNSKLNSKINEYRVILNEHIYKFVSYWNLDLQVRNELSQQCLTVKEVNQVDPNICQHFIQDAIRDNYKELTSLKDWIADTKELKAFEKIGIKSVEAWIFYNNRGEIDSNSTSFKQFRRTFDTISEFTIRQIVNAYDHGLTHVSDLIMEDVKDLSKKLKTTVAKVEELLSKVSEIPPKPQSLPNIGLVNSTIIDALKDGGIYSWSQIIGNTIEEEVNNIKGVTWNSVISLREYANVPLWHSLEIRELGPATIRKLAKNDVKTITHLLLLGPKFKEIIGNDSKYDSLMSKISRANLNKGQRQGGPFLSASSKIRVMDVPDYKILGITSPLDIILHFYSIEKNSPLIAGINDWIRISELGIEQVNFPQTVLNKLKKNKVKIIGDALLLPDYTLRGLGASNVQIKAFRTNLNRVKKTISKQKSTGLEKKPSKAKKKR